MSPNQKFIYSNLDDILIDNIDISMFDQLINLESIYFKKYSYCSYAPSVPRCRPLSDGTIGYIFST